MHDISERTPAAGLFMKDDLQKVRQLLNTYGKRIIFTTDVTSVKVVSW